MNDAVCKRPSPINTTCVVEVTVHVWSKWKMSRKYLHSKYPEGRGKLSTDSVMLLTLFNETISAERLSSFKWAGNMILDAEYIRNCEEATFARRNWGKPLKPSITMVGNADKMRMRSSLQVRSVKRRGAAGYNSPARCIQSTTWNPV
jgi:NADH:ubiquinone oxidoreductase subunit